MKMVLGVILGAAVGFAIGYFGKCQAGTCPLTSNPLVSTLIGAVIGFMVVAGK